MATVKKTIGRLPVYKGDWVAGTYSMLNQVTYLGSTFQSKIDNNTAIPATVVNNALQVNANWSVVSNGTAAYLADSRLTACETASTYAQAGVDTLRSNICGIYNTSFQTDISPSKNSTLCFWIKDSDATSYPKSILSNLSGTADSGIVLRINAKGVIDLKDFGSNLSQSINSNSRSFIAVSISDYAIDLYVNGEQKSMSISESFINGLKYRFFDQVDGVQKFDGVANSVMVFNTYMTKDDIYKLYNQGRCDEVVLGNEWRNPDSEIVPLFSAIKWGASDNSVLVTLSNDIVKIETSDIPITGGSYIRFKNSKIYKEGLYKFEFDMAGITTENIKIVSVGSTSALPISSYTITNGLNKIIVKTKTDTSDIGIAFKDLINNKIITLSNIKLTPVSIINEYLPQYLTKTKWIDSGANKQDIVLTSPTFTYTKPYKQYSNGTGAPNVIPDAAHTEYTDAATGNIWKCGGKPNTRQFAVSDWKQINN